MTSRRDSRCGQQRLVGRVQAAEVDDVLDPASRAATANRGAAARSALLEGRLAAEGVDKAVRDVDAGEGARQVLFGFVASGRRRTSIRGAESRPSSRSGRRRQCAGRGTRRRAARGPGADR